LKHPSETPNKKWPVRHQGMADCLLPTYMNHVVNRSDIR